MDLAQKYLTNLRAISMRCRVVRTELQDSERELADFDSRPQNTAAPLVLGCLFKEKEATMSLLESKRREVAQLEQAVSLIDAKIHEQEHQFEAVKENKTHLMEKVVVLRGTLEPLIREREKNKLLLRNYAPDIEYSDSDD